MYKVRPVEFEEKHPRELNSPFFKRKVDGRIVGRRNAITVNSQPVITIRADAKSVAPEAKPVNVNVQQTCCAIKCVIL